MTSNDSADHFYPELFFDSNYKLNSHIIQFEPDTIIRLPIYALKSASTDYDLTGQIVWPAADLLCRYLLVEGRRILKDCNVLELGSGCGLTGCLASLFAKSVVMTDGVEEVIPLLEKNIVLWKETVYNDSHLSQHTKNQLPPDVRIAQLDWKTASNYYHNPTELLKTEYFDVIIGSDVIYWPSMVEHFVNTLEVFLKPNGMAIITYVERSTSITRLFMQTIENTKKLKITQLPLYCQDDTDNYHIPLGLQYVTDPLKHSYKIFQIVKN